MNRKEAPHARQADADYRDKKGIMDEFSLNEWDVISASTCMNMFMAAGRDVQQLNDLVQPLTAGFYVSLHWPECVHARAHSLDTLRKLVAPETLSMADLAVASIDQLHALTLAGVEKGTDSYAAHFARRILFSLYQGNESEYAENGLKLLQDSWEVIFWTIAALKAESPQHPFLVSADVFSPEDAERGRGLMVLVNSLAGDDAPD